MRVRSAKIASAVLVKQVRIRAWPLAVPPQSKEPIPRREGAAVKKLAHSREARQYIHAQKMAELKPLP